MSRPRHVFSPLYRHYAVQDAIRVSKSELSSKHRQQILAAIGTELAEEARARLFEAIERTIALYRAWDAFERKHSPHAQIRAKIEQLHRRIVALEQTLKDLDRGARLALARFVVTPLEEQLPTISHRTPLDLSQLDERLCLAHEELPALAGITHVFLAGKHQGKSGPRPREARLAFAVDIADTLTKLAPTVKIVATAAGAYEAIVGICLEAAGARKGDLRQLIPKSVKAYKASYRPSGVKSPTS